MFILFNTVFNFKLKIDPKMCFFLTWKKFRIYGKIFEKLSGNPVTSLEAYI